MYRWDEVTELSETEYLISEHALLRCKAVHLVYNVTKLCQVSVQEELESVLCSRVILFIECCKDGVPVGGLY